MEPIGPYSHIAKAGKLIMISATAGADPATGELAGPDVRAQTRQIINSFKSMLASVGTDLDHVLHINIFLTDMAHYADMNAAYEASMGAARPARTVVAVTALPMKNALVTMNLSAVALD